MTVRQILGLVLAALVLAGCGAGCGSEKGKGTNHDLDKPTRPEK